MRRPSKRLGASVRWLLLSWAALFIMSLLIPLIARTGLVGVMVYLALFLLTAILCLLLWLVIRLWPRGRFRVLNFARALLVLMLLISSACVFIGGGITTNRFFGDRAELPLKDRFVAVIVCDGASLIQAQALLMEGLEDESLYATTISRNFPTISRYFIQNGAFTANGLSVWPSSSVPAHTGIMTGSYPRRTGIMGQRQFKPSQKRHTSYIGLGISMLSKILARDTKTLCEYFPDVRSLVLLQIVNRGCSLYVPATPHDEEVVKRACQVIEATDFLSRYSGKCEIPRIVVMTLPDIDHQTHNAPLNDERSRAIYLKQDEHIARIFDLYKSKGIFDRTLFVLCSDHGMEEVHNHLTIDNLMHDLRFEVYQSLKWVLMPQWGSFEANFWVGRKTLFDGPYNGVSLWGGNSDALVYIRGQRKDATGKVVEESWDIRPCDEDLRAYHVGGTSVDIIQRLFDYSAGIGLIFTNPQRHVFNVYSPVGQARILEREMGGMIEFQYTIVAGEDPLGYDENAAIRPYIHAGVWLSDQQWVGLTYLEHYPDALRRISYSFENANSGDMHIVASDGWDFTPYYVAKHVLSGSHGSLNKHASLVPIMFHGPGIKTEELPYARTVDIVPTILEYFGVESSSVDGRALPVFEDDKKNRDIMTDPSNVFAKRHFQDRHYTYTLEHSYASYDGRIVRTHNLTGEREVLVESVREALPELRTRLDISLDLIGFRNGALIFRKTYATEDRVGGIAAFDVTKREFR